MECTCLGDCSGLSVQVDLYASVCVYWMEYKHSCVFNSTTITTLVMMRNSFIIPHQNSVMKNIFSCRVIPIPNLILHAYIIESLYICLFVYYSMDGQGFQSLKEEQTILCYNREVIVSLFFS